jgi:hypothetical protein
MCMFCAAIPVTLAVGAATRQKQNRVKQINADEGKIPSKPVVPAGPVTAAIVTGLVVASVVYHTQIGGG